MLDGSPQSPEARRRRGQDGAPPATVRPDKLPLARRIRQVVGRVAIGVYSDGFIHAGNLAYLTLVALFPFFILAAAVAQIVGRSQVGLGALNGFLLTVPPNVAQVLRPAITDMLTMRTGNLLWIGSIVALWTVGSLIETIRDILRRAYGVGSGRPFWQRRLRAIGIVVASMLCVLFALTLQVLLSAAETLLEEIFPFANATITLIAASRLVPTLLIFVALHMLFVALTPGVYASRRFPKWPGAAFTALWWSGTSRLLPIVLAHLGNYSLTYGGLAGAMITLIFFFIIGLGVVIGAEINAALAEFPQNELAADTGDEAR